MRTLVALLIVGAAAIPLAAQTKPPAPDPKWLSIDPGAHHVTLQLDAATSDKNGGLNFDGYTSGDLTLTVPAGWRVTVRMKNRDATLPHSVALVSGTDPLPVQMTAPAVAGAATPSATLGTDPGDSATMTFAAPAGHYRLFCAVPGHGMAGMWIWLDVSESARTPSLHAGD